MLGTRPEVILEAESKEGLPQRASGERRAGDRTLEHVDVGGKEEGTVSRGGKRRRRKTLTSGSWKPGA